MEMSPGTPTAPEAARFISDLSAAVRRGIRRVAGAAAARLIRTGTALGQWAGQVSRPPAPPAEQEWIRSVRKP